MVCVCVCVSVRKRARRDGKVGGRYGGEERGERRRGIKGASLLLLFSSSFSLSSEREDDRASS